MRASHLCFLIGLVVTGIFVGILASLLYNTALGGRIGADLKCQKAYPLTSQSIPCDDYEVSAEALYKLEKKFNDAVEDYLQTGKAARVSVWVRDLETKQWAATKENDRFDQYAPASLLKVPLMIAYFKTAEVEPTILDTKLNFTKSDVLNSGSQDFMPAHPLVEGAAYTVRELIQSMIEDSNNDAAALLLGHLDQKIVDNTLVDLGLKIPTIAGGATDFVTAHTMATVFRILYNASYLNRAYSEEALSYLSKANFKGLTELLPADIVVAHKFGERETVDDGLIKRELHDCGIVYKPGRTYSICIMTAGASFDDLLTIVQQLSLLTYNEL
jgi:beta-lactamase class A